MKDDTGISTSNLDEQGQQELEKIQIPLWKFPFFFLFFVAIVTVDKWVEPVLATLARLV